jgi:hypothetical protein
MYVLDAATSAIHTLLMYPVKAESVLVTGFTPAVQGAGPGPNLLPPQAIEESRAPSTYSLIVVPSHVAATWCQEPSIGRALAEVRDIAELELRVALFR